MSAVIWLPYIYLSHINRHYDANIILCKVAHIDIIMTCKEMLRFRAETLLCLLCLSLFDSFKLSVRVLDCLLFHYWLIFVDQAINIIY